MLTELEVRYERGADLDRLQLIYRRTLYLTCKIKTTKNICFTECIVARYPYLAILLTVC
jgi:hypothetical protein